MTDITRVGEKRDSVSGLEWSHNLSEVVIDAEEVEVACLG